MPGTRSSAATKCISLVPGLEKQTSTPLPSSVRTRLSAPFTVSPSSNADSGPQAARKWRRRQATGLPTKPGARLPGMGRTILLGFAAGFVAVLVFHQGTAWLLHVLTTQAQIGAGLFGRVPAPFNMAPVPPFGVPTVL